MCGNTHFHRKSGLNINTQALPDQEEGFFSSHPRSHVCIKAAGCRGGERVSEEHRKTGK